MKRVLCFVAVLLSLSLFTPTAKAQCVACDLDGLGGLTCSDGDFNLCIAERRQCRSWGFCKPTPLTSDSCSETSQMSEGTQRVAEVLDRLTGIPGKGILQPGHAMVVTEKGVYSYYPVAEGISVLFFPQKGNPKHYWILKHPKTTARSSSTPCEMKPGARGHKQYLQCLGYMK